MRTLRAAWGIGVAILGGALPLGAQEPLAGRWAVRVQGEMLEDRGDLRFEGQGGRLLLESADSEWLPIDRIARQESTVQFRVVGGGLVIATLRGDSLVGLWHGPSATPARFLASRMRAGADEWPVGPRIRFREIVVGSDAASSQFSDAWRARLSTRAALLVEHARLAETTGLASMGLVGITQRAQAMVIGERPEGRQLAVSMLERIGKGPAADADFRRLFGQSGAWRVDIHQVAWDLAAARIGESHLLPDRLAEALQAAELLPRGAVDSAQIRRTLWEVARRRFFRPDGRGRVGLVDSVPQLLGARAVINAYPDAERWWHDAVRWLITHPWVETATGYASPQELVERFWQTDSLALPTIVPTSYGGMQAVPVLGVGARAPDLIEPANGIAREWLASDGTLAEAFATWRGLAHPDTPALPLVIGTSSLMLREPGEVVRSRLGGFIDLTDAILIDPTILPLFAVGTVVHEWQHLRFSAARFSDSSTGSWRSFEWGVRLQDGDPWLIEGAAEWATEQIFAATAATMPFFLFVEAEKRLALGAERPDDTHVLGYLLVRAAARNVGSTERTRDLLIRHLAEPEALANAIGLGGTASVTTVRPNTLMVIPELTFIPDGGVMRELTRRLLVPAFTPELP